MMGPWASRLTRGGCLAAVGVGLYDAFLGMSDLTLPGTVAVVVMAVVVSAPLLVATSLAVGWCIDVFLGRDTPIRRGLERLTRAIPARPSIAAVVVSLVAFCAIDWLVLAVAERVLDSDEYRTRAAVLAVLAAVFGATLTAVLLGRWIPKPQVDRRTIVRMVVALVVTILASALLLVPTMKEPTWAVLGASSVVFAGLIVGVQVTGRPARWLSLGCYLVFAMGFVFLFSSALRDTLAEDTVITRDRVNLGEDADS